MEKVAFPAWAYTAWWTEFPEDSREHHQRMSDFRAMVKGRGLPVVMMRDHEVVSIEFATVDNFETTRNVGTEYAPDHQTCCRFCGQRKDRFRAAVQAMIREDRANSHTFSMGLVRTIDPTLKSGGLMDSPTWTYTRCVHVRAWQDSKPGRYRHVPKEEAVHEPVSA